MKSDILATVIEIQKKSYQLGWNRGFIAGKNLHDDNCIKAKEIEKEMHDIDGLEAERIADQGGEDRYSEEYPFWNLCENYDIEREKEMSEEVKAAVEKEEPY